MWVDDDAQEPKKLNNLRFVAQNAGWNVYPKTTLYAYMLKNFINEMSDIGAS